LLIRRFIAIKSKQGAGFSMDITEGFHYVEAVQFEDIKGQAVPTPTGYIIDDGGTWHDIYKNDYFKELN